MKKWYISAVLLSCFSIVSPLVSADEPEWSFMIVGDSRGGLFTPKGFNERVMTELAGEIVRQEVDFVAFPGDLVMGGFSRQLEKQLLAWRQVMEPVYDAGIGVYPVRGNHDLGVWAGERVWRKVFSGRYGLPQNGPEGQKGLTYAVEHKNMLLLGLDQFAIRHRVDQDWVDEQLEKNNKPHIFAFGHLPAFGLKHSDCLDDYPRERNAFWESLEKAGCRVYAAAHDHFFNLARADDQDGDPGNDVHQLIAATAGAPLRDWSGSYNEWKSGMIVERLRHDKAYGYVLVKVMNDSEYRLIWHARDEKSGKYLATGPGHIFAKGNIELAQLVPTAEEWLGQG